MSEETLYQQGKVSVSTARVIIKSQTHALANVTSVRRTNTWAHVKRLLWGVLLTLVASCLAAGEPATTITAGIVIMMIAIPLALVAKPHVLLLSTAAGEVKAYDSRKKQEIDDIVAAINDAIVKRG